MRCLTQWRHLKALKRGGRGHDEAGASGTADGELAVLCPSCPHPGINLPTRWREESSDRQYVGYSIVSNNLILTPAKVFVLKVGVHGRKF